MIFFRREFVLHDLSSTPSEMRPSSSEKLRKWRNIYKLQLEHTRSHLCSASCAGLPLVTMGVYLPGKLRVDNCFACPSSTAASMYSVAFVSIAGANWSSSVNFIFYFFSQKLHSSSNKFLLCQSYLPTREFFKTPGR